MSNLRACPLPCGKERDAEIERLKEESARWFRYYSGLLAFVDPSVLVGDVQKAANEIAAERQRARLPDSLILRAKNTIEVCSFEDINFAGQLADEDMPLELLREFVAAVEGDK